MSADPASGFPVRVGAIDVGSNAIRFLAAEFLQPQHFTVLEQIRAPVRLGHAAFLTGRLTDEGVEAAVETLVRFQSRLEALAIDRYRAVATSAVRDSANGGELVERVRREARIRLEPITGQEEARLVHEAVRSRIDLGKGRWVLADLGGGSVEVSLVDADEIYWTVSHDMGSVRLLEELAVAGDEPGVFRRRLEEYAATLRIPSRGRRRPAGFIATGGNIEALAKLAESETDDRGVARLPLARLRETIEQLARMPYHRRVEDLSLREDRADVILPAAVVYERIATIADFDEILVPNVGVKDGIVLDLVDDVAAHGPHDDRHDQTVYEGALALGRRYRLDAPHGRHVAMLALALFDQLGELHGLSRADRRVLMAAGLLHDIGVFINYRKHHKHSFYILSQVDLPGLAPDEIRMVAHLARYHRKSEPSPNHGEFMDLPEDVRDRIVRMAGVLRIADALDREHLQQVRTVLASVEGSNLWLDIESTGDLVLERWAVHRKAGLFEKTFDLAVCFRGEADA